MDSHSTDIDDNLGTIAARVRSGRNRTDWRRAYVAKYGKDMSALTAAYLKHQNNGDPVHEWANINNMLHSIRC